MNYFQSLFTDGVKKHVCLNITKIDGFLLKVKNYKPKILQERAQLFWSFREKTKCQTCIKILSQHKKLY